MLTEASKQALTNLRDLSMVKWYVIPLLAIVFYIYTVEIKRARETGNWNAVFAGATLFGMDLINEVWNALVLHFTQYSAVWTTPGDTAFRILVGWNIEIAFMFSIAGIIFAHSLPDDKNVTILGIPNRWVLAIGYSAFCVFVEILLNAGNHLVWAYAYWHASFKGVWLIFLFGYFHFYIASFLVHDMEKIANKFKALAVIYGIGLPSFIIFIAMGWI